MGARGSTTFVLIINVVVVVATTTTIVVVATELSGIIYLMQGSRGVSRSRDSE